MINLMVGQFRLRYVGDCYIVDEEALTEKNDIVYRNQTYHPHMEQAASELLLHRQLPKKDISTIEDLAKEIKAIKKMIQDLLKVEVKDVHGD